MGKKRNQLSVNIAKLEIILIIALLLLIPLATAHEPGEELEATEGFIIELTPSQAIQGDEVPIEAHITKDGKPVTNLKVTFIVDKHDIGLSENLTTKEREPGHYFAEYKFVNSGLHEIHVEFISEGKEIRKTVDLNVVRTGIAFSFSLLFPAGATILLTIVWFFGLKGKKKKIKTSIILSLVIIAVAGIAYSLYITFITGAVQAGIVVCPAEDKCFWQAHIHAYVPISICGEDFRLPIEKGPLTGPHTHEEKNVIHWHDRLPYDKTNKRILDASPLTLGAFFDAIDVEFDSDRIADKKNDDACPDGSLGTLKVFVDGKQNNQFRNYVWKDLDVVVIVFDSRTAEEIETELAAKPIKFPALGRG